MPETAGQVTATPKTNVDDEVKAMQLAYEALRGLDSQARYRVTGWLNARLSWDSNEHDEEPF